MQTQEKHKQGKQKQAKKRWERISTEKGAPEIKKKRQKDKS